jgi:hypothetical protein
MGRGVNTELFHPIVDCKRLRKQFTPDPLTVVTRIDKKVGEQPLWWTQCDGSNTNDLILIAGYTESFWRTLVDAKPMAKIPLDLLWFTLLTCLTKLPIFVGDIKFQGLTNIGFIFCNVKDNGHDCRLQLQ